MSVLWEDNYLAHYGIREMRWGIRRFQNKDGSLTAEGKKRYLKHLDSKFQDAKKALKSKTSNKPQAINKQKADINEVMKRGKLSKAEASECISIANEIYDKAASVEPQITKDIVSSVSESGSSMFGLEYRLKQPTSLAAKIGSDAKEDNASFVKAASQIKDTIRYTSLADDNDFTSNYYITKSSLEKKGYTEKRCRNYFEQFKEGKVRHKAVQCVYEDPNGNLFELQFQTPLSQAAKELKIPIYEKRRRSGLSEKEKADLERQMTELAAYVPYPKDVFDIKTHG